MQLLALCMVLGPASAPAVDLDASGPAVNWQCRWGTATRIETAELKLASLHDPFEAPMGDDEGPAKDEFKLEALKDPFQAG